jgi:hypothetical protein
MNAKISTPSDLKKELQKNFQLSVSYAGTCFMKESKQISLGSSDSTTAPSDDVWRAFRRMDEGLKRILLEQEQRRRAGRKVVLCK